MSFDIDVTLSRGNRSFGTRFSAPSGLTALFGPSGAGKTTILDMIAGLVKPDSGRIVVDGRVMFDSEQRVVLPPEHRSIGYVFQDGRLFPHKRVRDNLLYGWKLAQPEDRWLPVEQALDLLGIGHLLDRNTRTLSGGEAQRVAIGRALLSGPRLLLMDEPLSSLDHARRGEIMGLIERIRDELSVPILYVSHDRAEVDRLAGTVIEIG